MIKKCLLAATVALTAAPAFAQAVPIEVELEGLIQNWDNPSRTLTVMGTQVYVPPTTTMATPAATREESGVGLNPWWKGLNLPGRNRPGMMGGTAIVVGTWDAQAGRIVAQDIAAEPGENVILGAVTGSWCSTANCDGPVDFIRGNSAVGGGLGPAMLPIRDPRMPAGPVRDEAGFSLNLAGINMVGRPFAAEGYYGDIPVTVQTGTTGQTVQERAFHYFILDMATVTPELYLNKNVREVSALRTRCNVGDRFEARGHVHTTMNAAGQDNDAINANSGVISVQYRNANGQLVRVNGGAATPIAGAGAVGRFRVRFDTNFCPETYTIRWLPNANSPDSAAYASLTDIGIDRLREDDPED